MGLLWRSLSGTFICNSAYLLLSLQSLSLLYLYYLPSVWPPSSSVFIPLSLHSLSVHFICLTFTFSACLPWFGCALFFPLLPFLSFLFFLNLSTEWPEDAKMAARQDWVNQLNRQELSRQSSGATFLSHPHRRQLPEIKTLITSLYRLV